VQKQGIFMIYNLKGKHYGLSLWVFWYIEEETCFGLL